jgi:hypothetical protein
MGHQTYVRVFGSSFLTGLFTLQAHGNDAKPAPFEFHAYGRLGITTNEKLSEAGKDQGDGSFGLPTSRHIRDTNYLRIQAIGNSAPGNTFNIEAQFENLPHLTNSWPGTGINLRNAYFQTSASADTELWFGARRLEFEDVRLFDKFPLSETTFYGVGAKLPIAGAPTVVAVGFKNRSSILSIAKNEADASAGNTDATVDSRDTSLFVRHDLSLGSNLALRPTLILSHSGEAKLNGSPLNTYKTSIPTTGGFTANSTHKKTLSGKVGAVLSHWGDAGWGNHFLWIEQRAATGTSGGSNKDTIFGLASSTDYEGWSSSNVGLMYGLMLEHTQFKNAQAKYNLKNDELIPSTTSTSKSNTVLALGMQPVYYITDRLHAALDLNHTLTSKVGLEAAKPNMTFITPIIRYASNKTALATPQFYTSFTYGIYETKARQTASGSASKNSLTTQTGCEFWF